ncbi:hypothetical protein NOCARDAX2BIS_180015 [Nocardioides sp. AX2bis]|nr:hypothetical protein NOCARDAX2BIS_180015 [Nocardioides sp. AX2bis]
MSEGAARSLSTPVPTEAESLLSVLERNRRVFVWKTLWQDAVARSRKIVGEEAPDDVRV